MFCFWTRCGTSRIPRIRPWSGRSQSVEKLAPRRAFFTHICHDLGHACTEERLPPHVRLAYDGLEIEVGKTARMIYRSLAETPADFGPCAITIGNFDGVHCGHRQILRRVIAMAREEGWKSAVLTFDPHPAKLVAPERRAAFADDAGGARANHSGAGNRRDPDSAVYARDRRARARGFRARDSGGQAQGAGGAGGREFSFRQARRRRCRDAGRTRATGSASRPKSSQPVVWRKRVISSSEIRRCIEAGDVSTACRMLGRPYALRGAVVPGEGRGSKQTVPTLNLDTKAEVLPKNGVYVTRTRDARAGRANGRRSPISAFGRRSTARSGPSRRICFRRSMARRPRKLRWSFCAGCAMSASLKTPEALKAQILRDVNRAQTYFRRLGQTASAR